MSENPGGPVQPDGNQKKGETAEPSGKDNGNESLSRTKRVLGAAKRGAERTSSAARATGRGAKATGRGIATGAKATGKYTGATSAAKKTGKGIKKAATARPTKFVGRKLGRAGYRAGRGVLNKAAPAGSARAQALQKGVKYGRNLLRSGVLAARVAKKTVTFTLKRFRDLSSLGPVGWIAILLILMMMVVLWLVFYFNASAGNFASVRPEEKEQIADYGLSDDIPQIYFRLYKEAAELYDVPWQILAAWGEVATDHGRRSPYDCVQRIDPTSVLGYTTALETGLGGDSFLKEQMLGVNPAGGRASSQGWMPELDFPRGNVHNHRCGPYGWLHQWCKLHTNTAPLAPDPPIGEPGVSWVPTTDFTVLHSSDYKGDNWISYNPLSSGFLKVEERKSTSGQVYIVCIDTRTGTTTSAYIDMDPEAFPAAPADINCPTYGLPTNLEDFPLEVVEKLIRSMLAPECEDNIKRATEDNALNGAIYSFYHGQDENGAAVARKIDLNAGAISVDTTVAGSSADEDRPPEGISFGDSGKFCGPMLLKPSEEHSCRNLQNPSYAIEVVAETIGNVLDELEFLVVDDPRYASQADLLAEIAGVDQKVIDNFSNSGGDFVEAWNISLVDVPYSTNSVGDVLRSTSEFFSGYWAVILDSALADISSADMGLAGDCSDATGMALPPGDPTNFTFRVYCYLALNGAPPYHDWRLSGLANEGIAVGDLAARLWAKDLTRVAWVWNEWGNPRGSYDADGVFHRSPGGRSKPRVEDDSGGTCHSLSITEETVVVSAAGGAPTTHTEKVPLYSGVWIPFPAVSCEELGNAMNEGEFDGEPEYAAYLIQKKGWGGLAGHVHTNTLTCFGASLHSDEDSNVFADIRAGNKWKRYVKLHLYYDTTESGDAFCPPAMKLHEGRFRSDPESTFSATIKVAAEVSESEESADIDTSAEEPEAFPAVPADINCPTYGLPTNLEDFPLEVVEKLIRSMLAPECEDNIKRATEDNALNGAIYSFYHGQDENGAAVAREIDLNAGAISVDTTVAGSIPTGSSATDYTVFTNKELKGPDDPGNPDNWGSYLFTCEPSPSENAGIGDFRCTTVVEHTSENDYAERLFTYEDENGDEKGWDVATIIDAGLLAPTWTGAGPVDGCGDPYTTFQSGTAPTPHNNCLTYVVPSWATLGSRCALPGRWLAGQVRTNKSMPAGHDFFPASRTSQFAATKQTEVSEMTESLNAPNRCGSVDEYTPKLEPTRAITVDSYTSLGSFAATRRLRHIDGEIADLDGFLPLLPSVAYPAISDPAPHTYLGWAADIETHLSAVDAIDEDLGVEHYGGNWSAGREIAYRARWLTGGVQTEQQGSVEIDPGDGFGTVRYLAQDRAAQTDRHLVLCGGAMLAAGAVCDSWKDMKAAAEADGVSLMVGSSHRSAQEQYNTRRANQCNKGGEATATEILTERWQVLGCTVPTARVGTSMHQYGYALDFNYLFDDPEVIKPETRLLDETRPEFLWLRTHAWRWGWYNVPVEPWHWSTTGA